MTSAEPTGAGASPPWLAKQDELRHAAGIAVARLRAGRSAKSLILLGERGVGKTALLKGLRVDMEHDGVQVVWMEAAEGGSLPSLLVPELHAVLLCLSGVTCAEDLARRSLQALAAFAKGLKAKYHDIDIELDVEPEPGLADSGGLESDLLQLLEVVGEAVKRAGSALVLCIDDLQLVEERQLGALLGALHRANQDELPVILICAGTPQLRGRIGNAKPYAERLFEFQVVGAPR